jgi:hypothetical protein
MVSVFSAVLGLEEPANGDYPGTWGSAAVNPNMVILDAALGAAVVIDLSAGSVTLSSNQVRSANLVFAGTLPGNVTVTVPALGSGTIPGRNFGIYHGSLNSSLYTVTIQSTVAGSRAIGARPSDFCTVTVSNQTGSFYYTGLPPIGSYMDFGGSSVPAWIAACTVPPYLNCDGTSFSSVTYPALANHLGGTTLPDSRGRFRATLNQGQGRITSGTSLSGVDGNTILSASGVQVITLSSQNMPPVLITDPGHKHNVKYGQAGTNVGAGGINLVQTISSGSSQTGTNAADTATTGITAGTTLPTNFSIIPPTYMGGLTLIRAG